MRPDDAINHYLRETDQAPQAYQQDPQYSLQIKWLRQMLNLVDTAMLGEGVSEAVRVRVVEMALYGTAEDPADAVAKIRGHAEAVQALQGEVVGTWPWLTGTGDRTGPERIAGG